MSWWNRHDREPWAEKAQRAGIAGEAFGELRTESVTIVDPELAARFGKNPGERVSRADWLVTIDHRGNARTACASIRQAARRLEQRTDRAPDPAERTTALQPA